VGGGSAVTHVEKRSQIEQYILAEHFSNGAEIEISSTTFLRLASSRNFLIAMRTVEDLFSITIKAFGEFEKKLLSISVDYSHGDPRLLHNHREYMDSLREEMNLTTLNVSTTGNALNDQLLKNAKKLEPKLTGFKSDMPRSFSSQYDTSFEDRVVSALRNTAQHSELPVGKYTLGGKRLHRMDDLNWDGPSRSRTTVDPSVSVEKLKNNSRVNAKFRDELSALEHTGIDLKFALRGYIACIAQVVTEFRDRTDHLMRRSLCHLEAAEKRLAIKKGKTSVDFVSAFRMQDGKILDEIALAHEIFVPLKAKRKNWTQLTDVQWKYISSETTYRTDVWPTSHKTILIEK
jgi:hypothetical protein